jgi:hypothetical protein
MFVSLFYIVIRASSGVTEEIVSHRQTSVRIVEKLRRVSNLVREE